MTVPNILFSQAPTASFTVSPASGNPPLLVNFDASASIDPDGGALTAYDWDFGDGNVGTGVTPTNTFTSPGAYSVVLTVTDDETDTDDTTIVVQVFGPPVASFVPSTTNGDAPLTVNFDASASLDIDGGTIASYAWDYGDGNIGTGATPSHTFTTDGSFDVVLTVTDDEAVTDDTTITIIVNPVDPIASFTRTPVSGSPPLLVNFDALASNDPDGGAIASYAWTFGDGNGGAGATPSNTYTSPGVFSVTLTVTDDEGATDDSTATIQVFGPPTASFVPSPTTGDAPLTVNFDASASFDIDGGTIASYAWDYGDGNVGTGATPSHTFTTDGSFDVVLTVTDDEAVTDDTTITILVNPVDPIASFTRSPVSGNAPLLVNLDGSASTDPDGGAIANYAWNFGDGNGGAGVTTSNTYTSPGVFSVTLTVTDDEGATDDSTATIQVFGPPTASFIPSPNTGEAPLTVNFDASASSDIDGGGIVSYSWDYGDGNVGTGATPSHTFTTDGSFDVVLTVTDDEAVTDDTTITIIVNPVDPIASFTRSPVSGNPPLLVSFDASASTDPDGGILDYDWDFGDGNVGIGSTTSNTYTSPGIYSVTLKVTDDELASDDSTATIQVFGPPTASFTATPPSGNSPLLVNFDASASFDIDGGSIVSYAWDFGDGNIDTGISPSHTFTASGSFSVQLTVTDDEAVTDDTTIVVQVFGPPLASFTRTPTSGNPPLLVNFDASASNDPDGGAIASYAWTFGDGNIGTGATPTNTFTAPGLYPVTLTVTDDEAVTDDSTATIQVFGPPTASFIPTPASGNPPLLVNFDASASSDIDGGSITSYTWDYGDGNVDTGVSPSHTFTSPGTYSVTLTVTDDEAVTDDTTIVVQAFGPPIASFTQDVDSGLVPLNVNLDATGSSDTDGGTIANYAWDFGDGNGGSGAIVSHTYTTIGTYNITLTVTDDEGATDDSVSTARVFALPIASFVPTPTAGNAPLNVSFDASASNDPDGGGIVDYSWDFGDGNVGTGVSPSHTFLIDGSYNVELIVTDDEGAIDDTTIVINVNAVPPIASFTQSATSGDTPLLVNFDASASNDPDGGPIVSYNWDFGDGNVATGVAPSHTYTGAGLFSITLSVEDDEGSTDDTTTTVFVLSQPFASFSASPQTGDAPLTVSFDASASNDPDGGSIASYAWDLGDGNLATGVNPNHTYLEDGSYIVTLTVTDDEGATDDSTFTIIANPVDPVLSFTASPLTGNAPLTVAFDASASNDPDGGAISSFNWDFGDGNAASGAIANHTYTLDGTYKVIITITDDEGTIVKDSTTINALAVPPIVDLQSDIVSGDAPLTVNFDGSGSSDPDGGAIVGYSWDFGDGNTGAGATISHTYNGPGIYNAVLTILDDEGTTNKDSVEITANAVAPVASFTIDTTFGDAPLLISFDGTASNDPDGGILTYTWDFGDGSPTDDQATTSHTYTIGGTFTVTLTIEDDEFQTAIADTTVQIFVTPTASFVANPQNGQSPLNVNFDASASSDPDGGSIVSYAWDFGDGAVGAGQILNHTYAAGLYTAKLVITDDEGEKDSTTVSIQSFGDPVVSFNATPLSGDAPLTVNFDASASFDPDTGPIVSYLWDFGDGNTGLGQTVSHTFTKDSTFTVTLVIIDNDGASSSATINITVNPVDPIAVIDASPLIGDAPLTVDFDASGSSDPDSGPLTYAWDLGDGNTATGPILTHLYAEDGTYTVTLTVTDDEGDTDVATVVITANDVPPITSLIATPLSGNAPLTVNFDGSGSNDPDGGAVSISWDFGDGNTATGPITSHVYPFSGSYTVTLTVTDDELNINTETVTITAIAVPPVADFTATPEVGDAPLSVDFDASASFDPDGGGLTYSWDFGDGTNGAGQVINHIFNEDGVYTVTLAVTDNELTTTLTTKDITVNAVPPIISFTADPTSGDAPLTVSFDASASNDPDGGALNFSWDFGDGNTGTGATIDHTFLLDGTYTVVLTIQDDEGTEVSDNVTIIVSEVAPVATFTATPQVGNAPLNVLLDASASFDPDGGPLSYAWDLGDGNTATGVTVNHTYPEDGDYTVVLTVTDDENVSVSFNLTITANPVPPIASFTADPTTGDAPLSVDFDAGASFDPDGGALIYQWDFGDGNNGVGETVTHVFAEDGLYTVTLTVIDDETTTSTTTLDINVLAVPPIIDFTANPLFGNPPLTVNVDASASFDPDGGTLSYDWDFGDGGDATGVSASHIYTAAGTYTLTLTITDDENVSVQATETIKVNAFPVAVAGNDQTLVDFDGNGEETATLNGSGSFDTDGTIVSYSWKEGNVELSTQSIDNLDFNVGEHEVELTVTDDIAGIGKDTVLITVLEKPEFSNATATAFPSVSSGDGWYNANLMWGDFDMDGDLDLFGMGQQSPTIFDVFLYENNNGVFSLNNAATSNIVPLANGAMDLADMDNDGDLDMLICGENSDGNPFSALYTFNGSAFIADVATTTTLKDVGKGDIKWWDYDNDGDLDIILSGESSQGPSTEIYTNNGVFGFANNALLSSEFGDFSNSSIAIGDFNNDGWVDVLIQGFTGVTTGTLLFRNLTNGNFTLQSLIIDNYQNGSLEWADYNNDGNLDFLISGSNAVGEVATKVYEGDGTGDFFDIGTSLVGIQNGNATWGDFNDDGYPDILLSGQSANGPVTKVYESTGGPNPDFVENVSSSFIADQVEWGSIAWGDYDNDNKLDYAVTGRTNSAFARSFSIFKNDDLNTNLSPLPPVNLNVNTNGTEITFSWEVNPSYPISLADGLSYAVYLGTIPGAIDVISPNSDLSNGYRKVVKMGRIQNNTSFTLKNLQGGNYFWSVQAIDQDHEGSVFASPENTFTYVPPGASFFNETNSIFASIPTGIEDASFAWGDYDNDNDLDFAVMGSSGGTKITDLYAYDDQASQFVLQSAFSAVFDKLSNGSMAWGDINNDNAIDLAIMGNDGNGPITRIYINNNGNFNSGNVVNLVGVENGEIAWGDFDNDGFQDLLIVGSNGSAPVSRVFRNNQNNSFTDVGALLTPVQSSSADWLDFNNDGFLDIFITGQSTSGTVSELYQNDQDGGFTPFNFTFPGVRNSDVAIADIDNDGDVDIILSGDRSNSGPVQPFTQQYRNNNGSSFEAVAGPLEAIYNGVIVLGDYNNDGWIDAFLAGKTGTGNFERVSSMYLNTGSGSFQEDPTNSEIIDDFYGRRGAAFGDYDLDGRLDLVLGGNTLNASGNGVFRLFHNIDPSTPTIPQVPLNLSAIQFGNSVRLDWDAPLGASGYTYNIYVEQLPGQTENKSPLANVSSGFRKVVSLGNVGSGTQWSLNNLGSGTYRWSVQSIDQDYQGSAFASVGTFNYTSPEFLETTDEFGTQIPNGLSDASMSWGDFDNDDDLDLLLSGSDDGTATTLLFRNDVSQNAGFNETVGTALTKVSSGSVSWIDADLDGNLDVLITGRGTGGVVANLFLGTGSSNGNFNIKNDSNIPAVENSSTDWADFDQDGDPDLLITGRTEQGSRISEIYLNDGSGGFINAGVNLIAVQDGDAQWADFDNDGDMDIVVTGESISGPVTKVYQQDNSGQFNELLNTIPGVSLGSVDWGDFNHDNFFDLLITGSTDNGRIASVYTYNIATNAFDIAASIDSVENGDAVWGDYDNDGFQDVFVTGQSDNFGFAGTTVMFRNNGGLGLIKETINSEFFSNFNDGSEIALADYDNDGKLDLAITGKVNQSEAKFKLYKNINSDANTAPGIPVNLITTQEGYDALFQWQAPLGVADPNEYSYNIYIGTTSNGEEQKGSLSNLQNGTRKIVHIGNVGHATSFRLRDIVNPGNFFWSVQAVGADFEGSEFASEEVFTFLQPSFVDSTQFDFPSNDRLNLNEASVAWGDYDNDNDLDFVAVGMTDSIPQARIYRNVNGNLVNSGIVLEGLSKAAVAWGDFNEDGWLDLAYTGEDDEFIPKTKIYINNQGTFQELDPSEVPEGVREGDINIVDYDNDGDQDIFLVGEGGVGPSSVLYRNDGAGAANFSRINVNIEPLRLASSDWADYDRDGDMDVLVSGEKADGTPLTEVFRNNSGLFEELGASASLAQLKQGDVSWGDFDNNGYPDILISGLTNINEPFAEVYQNNTFGFFQSMNAGIPGVSVGSLAWGDVDNDGYQEFVISGKTGLLDTDRSTEIYTYNPISGNFARDNVNSVLFPNLDGGSSIAWGDYNGDLKLDLLLVGLATAETGAERSMYLFQNIVPGTVSLPQSPSNLSSATDVLELDQVNLAWFPPTGFSSTILEGLTYGVYIKDSTGQILVSPLADISSGMRKVVDKGNAGYRREIGIKGLPTGKYFWSVQAIGQDFQASGFAPEDSFRFEAPIFTDVTVSAFGENPEGLINGDLDWGDFDNDSDLDLIVTGESNNGPFTRIFENNGNGNFSPINEILLDLAESSVEWGDFNNDGNLDFVISGSTANQTNLVRIYKGDGAGGFAITSISIQGVKDGDVTWGDYDNDGDLDLSLTGGSILPPENRIYRNRFNSGLEQFIFSGAPSGIGVTESKQAWGDYDNDGDLDLVITGQTQAGQPSTLLYQNNIATGAFVIVPFSFENVFGGNVAWGDYDNDGDLDLLVVGNNGSQGISKIYRNDNGQAFVDINAPIDGVSDGEGEWGDYNDDGYMDILLVGNDGNQRIANIYRNDPNAPGGFVLDVEASFTLQKIGVDQASVAWADFNNDGKLDIGLLGQFSDNPNDKVFRLYKNGEPTRNGVPGKPEGLSADLVGNDIVFRWEPPSNYLRENSAGGVDTLDVAGRSFSYNIFITAEEEITEDSSRIIKIVDPMANVAEDGYRKVVRLGNVNHVNVWDLLTLGINAEISFSVQAVDTDFDASGFADTLKLSFVTTAFNDVSAGVLSNINIPSNASNPDLDWGDYDNDGDLDLIFSAELSENDFLTTVYENVNQSFFEDTAARDSLADVRWGTVTWGDYDNDGDLDAFVSGQNESLERRSSIYENEGGIFSFNESASANLIPVYGASAAWGDYNNDGLADLVISGSSSSGPVSQVFRNEYIGPGNHRFILDATASQALTGVVFGSIAMGDFNRDNYLDLVITGEEITGSPFSQVYKNEKGVFTELTGAPIIDVKDSDVAWGDYNNDGYYDLLMIGETTASGFQPTTKIYEYNPALERFEEFFNTGLREVRNGSVSWGDYNADGFLDILLVGKRIEQGDTVLTSRLYKNDAASGFSEDLRSSVEIGDYDFASSAWGDFNGDDRLDIVLGGVNDTLAGVSVYQNLTTRNNGTLAPSPDSLKAEVIGDEIHFSWEPPVGFFADDLTFNVRVGWNGNQIDRVGPMADSLSGKRQVVRYGNAGHNLTYVLKAVPDGEYCWSVQSVNQNFYGGAFAPTKCITYVSPRPVITGADIPYYRNWGRDTTATISTSDTSVISRVLFYAKGISEAENAWNSPIDITRDGSSPYSIELNDGMYENLREIGLMYYFVVEGKFGLDAVSDTFYTYLRFSQGNVGTVQLPTVGAEVVNYNVVTIPFRKALSQTARNVSDVFGLFGEYDTKKWRFFYLDNGETNFKEYNAGSDTPLMEPGRGYWVIKREDGNYIPGGGITVESNPKSPYTWDLEKGWNMIGNPYYFNLGWADILSHNRSVAPTGLQEQLDMLQFLIYNAGYVSDQQIANLTLNNFAGGFIFADSAFSIEVPVLKNPNVQRLGNTGGGRELTASFDESNWEVDLSLTSGDLDYVLGGIGMNKQAQEGRDVFDKIASPRFGFFLEMSTEHPEYFSPRFTRDVVPTQEQYVWDVNIVSNMEREAIEISWDNSYFGANDKQLYLYDVERQTMVNMREVETYRSWSDTEVRPFKLIFGPQSFIDEALSPHTVAITGPYPNPASDWMNIPFVLPEQPFGSNYEIQLEMYNLVGQRIRTLIRERYPSGFHEAKWDLMDDRGTKVPEGVYLVRLKALVGGKEQDIFEKVIVK